MKIRIDAMFNDVIGSLIRKPATRRYPFERVAAPDRLRGKLLWDAEKCTACSLCVKDCPAEALEVSLVDKASKRIVFRYHLDRCTYCAQCVISCRTQALTMAHDAWELAGTDKSAFTITYGDQADVQRVDDRAAAVAQPGA